MNSILFDFGGTIDTDGVHWSEKYWELYERHRTGVAKPAFERAFVESEKMLNADPSVARMTFRETLEKQLNLAETHCLTTRLIELSLVEAQARQAD